MKLMVLLWLVAYGTTAYSSASCAEVRNVVIRGQIKPAFQEFFDLIAKMEKRGPDQFKILSRKVGERREVVFLMGSNEARDRDAFNRTSAEMVRSLEQQYSDNIVLSKRTSVEAQPSRLARSCKKAICALSIGLPVSTIIGAAVATYFPEAANTSLWYLAFIPSAIVTVGQIGVVVTGELDGPDALPKPPSKESPLSYDQNQKAIADVIKNTTKEQTGVVFSFVTANGSATDAAKGFDGYTPEEVDIFVAEIRRSIEEKE